MTTEAIVDGRRARRGTLARLRRRGPRLMVSRAEHDEAVIERRLLAHPGVTRANTVAVMSPAGGVGKTTCAFVIASVLAGHLKLRVAAVDASPQFGTLEHLVPPHRRPQRDLRDLLDDERIVTAAQLAPYVARLPTGLHVLTARLEPTGTGDPSRLGELIALLSCFYDVVLLDLAPGIVGPLARTAATRADQAVLVATPGTIGVVLDALDHLPRHDRATVVVNQSDVTIPHDPRLARMLETGTYSLGALAPDTRVAVKRLALAVADKLL
jgi:cellulose biosynthesis protein BcsQ